MSSLCGATVCAGLHQHFGELIVDLKNLSRKMASGTPGALRPRGGAAANQAPSGELMPTRKLHLAWAVAATTAIGLLGVTLVHLWHTAVAPPEPALLRFAFTPPVRDRESWYTRNAVISPNGRHIAMSSAAVDGRPWIQDVDDWQPRSFEDTEGAVAPFCRPTVNTSPTKPVMS